MKTYEIEKLSKKVHYTLKKYSRMEKFKQMATMSKPAQKKSDEPLPSFRSNANSSQRSKLSLFEKRNKQKLQASQLVQSSKFSYYGPVAAKEADFEQFDSYN
jgi:hypothetical protein